MEGYAESGPGSVHHVRAMCETPAQSRARGGARHGVLAARDADQDGVVYYMLPAVWDGNYDMEPVDGAKYRTWRESFLEGASKLDDIWFWDLKEENIAILGAEKPD